MNKAMKLKFVLAFFILFTVCGFGQEKRDKVKIMRATFITTALNLSETESQKFWAIYNTYEEKEYDLRHNVIRPINEKMKGKGIDAMKTTDALMYMIELQNAEEKLFNLRKKLLMDLKPVIGPKKVLKLLKAEDDFTVMLLNKYKEGKRD